MSLLSIFRKNKQEAAAAPADSDEGVFQSRAQDESDAVRGRGKRAKESSRTKQVDPMLPEKKRARRRLVGALALVLTMVIVLPMVLDSEPKPLADDIAIQIPSKDKAADKRASPAPAHASLPPTAALDPNETVVTPPVAAPSLPTPAPAAAVTAPKAKSESPGENASPATSQKAEAPKKENEPKAKPVEKKVESKPEPKPEITESKAKPESKPAPAPAKVATKPAVEKNSEAARAQAILEGRVGESSSHEKPSGAAEAKPTRVVVQVAALAAQDKVNELQSKLSEAGIKSYTQKVSTQSGERIRVRIGPFASKEEADKMRAKLQKLGIAGTLVPS